MSLCSESPESYLVSSRKETYRCIKKTCNGILQTSSKVRNDVINFNVDWKQMWVSHFQDLQLKCPSFYCPDSITETQRKYYSLSFTGKISCFSARRKGQEKGQSPFARPKCESLKAFGLYKRSKKSPHGWFACSRRSSKSASGWPKRRPFTRCFLWHNSLCTICFARLAV